MQHVKFYSQTVKILMHKVSLSAQKVISNITVIVHRHETSVNFFLEAKNNFQFCRQGFLGKNSFFFGSICESYNTNAYKRLIHW